MAIFRTVHWVTMYTIVMLMAHNSCIRQFILITLGGIVMDTGELYFGQRLQYLREECGMSREQACSSLALNGYNVGVSTLKKWEAC